MPRLRRGEQEDGAPSIKAIPCANMAIVQYKINIKLSLVIFTIFLLLLVACQQSISPTPGKITSVSVLHTNDIHGHLDNMPRLATAVTRIRGESGKDNTLLLDAGDVFAGSVYFQLYQGQASLWFMNYLGYDAMCPGNHEFDGGLKTLAEFVAGAGFRVVSANLKIPSEKTLNGKITPWVIMEKNGARYGILGLITDDTAGISIHGGDITIDDDITAARRAVSELKKKGINKIIALTHLGWEADLKLARQVGDIDIVIGGHTHTVPEVYPAVVDEDGSPALIAQAGDYARYLGRLNVSFDSTGVVQDWTGSELVPLGEGIVEDNACAAKLAEYRVPVAKTLGAVIGKTLVDLDGERANVRSRETNLGNLVADSMLHQAGDTGTGIAIINGGAIRTSIPAGDVTLEQAKAVLPFDNYLVAFNLTGEQIVVALENGVSQAAEVQGRFPQVAGLRFVWNPEAKPGSRIVSVEVKKASGYEPINLSATYRVVTNNFLYGGGDGYTMFATGADFINFGDTDYQVLAAYITANSPVNPRIEGRIRRQ